MLRAFLRTGSAHNMLKAQAENVEREAEIIAQAGRPGRHEIANQHGLTRPPTSSSGGKTAITCPPQKLPRCCCPLCVRGGPPSPPVHCAGGCGRWLSAASPGPGPCPQRGPRHRRPLPPAPSRPTEQSLVERQGNWSGWWIGPCSVLNSQTHRPAGRGRPHLTTPQSHLRSYHPVRAIITMAVVQEEEERVRQARRLHVTATERHESHWVTNAARGGGARGNPGKHRAFPPLGRHTPGIFGGIGGRLMHAFRVKRTSRSDRACSRRSLVGSHQKNGRNLLLDDHPQQVFEYDEVMKTTAVPC